MKQLIYMISMLISGMLIAQNKTILTIYGEKIHHDIQMSTVERNGKYTANPPTEGTRIFNTTTKCHEFWNGSGWYNYCWGGVNPPNTVVTATGKIWMDKNLGATQVAQSETDHLAYGSLYQWGRRSDGHELINWTSAAAGTAQNGVTTILSVSDTPANALFITMNASPYDWMVTRNNNLWQGVSGANNPCPSGYRLPTMAEWDAELVLGNITNSATAYSSPLKLVKAGGRGTDGAMYNVGIASYYWSSNAVGSGVKMIAISSGVVNNNANQYRASGSSVRCIKD